MLTRRKRLSLIVILMLGAIVPFSTTVIPEWEIQVVDEESNPVADFEVRQTWSNGPGEHIEAARSDSHGFVVFPERTVFLPIILRLPLQALNVLNGLAMPHGAETSARAYIWSGYARNDRWLHYKKGEPLKNRLIVENPFPKKQ